MIGGLQKVTLLDFPGKVACTVFLTGCDLRCPYCHNPELVLPRDHGKMDSNGTVPKVLEHLLREKLLDHVAIPIKTDRAKSTSCCRIEATTGGAVMPRRYTKVEALSEEVFRRKAAGETNREIGAHFGLSKAQIKGLISR